MQHARQRDHQLARLSNLEQKFKQWEKEAKLEAYDHSPIEVIEDVEICGDCRIYLFNGELPAIHDEETNARREKEILAGEERQQPWRFSSDPHNRDESFFTHRSCECCEANEGGDRYYVALVRDLYNGRDD